MSRPLLNLSIVGLIDKLEASPDSPNVALDLLNELRHRATPKANALNKRVMTVIAKYPSVRVIQSLFLPELEVLATLTAENAALRDALIEVLLTRNSAKAEKVLERLQATEGSSLATGPIEPPFTCVIVDTEERSSDETQVPLPALPPKQVLLSAAAPQHPERGPTSVEVMRQTPLDVEKAFNLFEVPDHASWGEVEIARQKLVFKYRPGSGIEKEQTRAALNQIAAAHALLAKYMQSKG
jgi:hypothetical protein